MATPAPSPVRRAPPWPHPVRRGAAAVRRLRRRAVAAVIVAAVACGAAAARSDDELALPYEVTLTGIDEAPLKDLIETESRLIALGDRPPATMAGLRRRAEEDMARLRALLRAEGYYAGDVAYRIAAGTRPIEVTVEVAPGPVYALAAYRVDLAGEARPPQPIVLDYPDLGLDPGGPARAADIVAAQKRLLAALANRAYPFAAVADRQVVVDHARRAVTVTVRLELGPPARFGTASFSGLGAIDEDFARAHVAWDHGAPFDARKLEATRRELMQSGLFNSVRVSHADAPDADGTVPVTFDATERRPRSLGAGASYSTSEGVGGKAFWEHRNLFGGGERLRTTAEAAQIRLGVNAGARKPFFLDPAQDLVADASFEREDTDAFTSTGFETAVGLERRLDSATAVGGGLSFEHARVEEDGDDDVFNLVGVPLTLRRDTTDDLLDPGRGSRLRLSATPYPEFLGSTTGFVVARATDSIYRTVIDDRLVLAGWARLGTIFGADTDEVPADKRLFAGGGGSVRAFGFQLVGPVDAGGDPTGGRSSVELGGEARFKVTDTIGGVVFLEAGNVYDDPFPDLDDPDFLWGGGVGFRYHTAIGPLRLDFAFPFNRRPGVDDVVQFYISLGQAF